MGGDTANPDETLSTHITPMDRQIQESLNIILETRKEGSCLNQKSEWASTKIPDLEVRNPKGVARLRKDREGRKVGETGTEEYSPSMEDDQKTGGDKRIRQQDSSKEETCQMDQKTGGVGQETLPPLKRVCRKEPDIIEEKERIPDK